MKKKNRIILLAAAGIILVLSGKICFNYIYNYSVNFLYHIGDYNLNVEPLKAANFFEPYVAWYNDGCIDFKKGRYVNAQNEFQKALTFKIPEKKECDIRVNLVLSMLAVYDWTGESQLDGEELLEDLYECRDILLEDGCATDRNDGHDVEAQRLKNEIDDLIEMLESQKQQSDNEEGDGALEDDDQAQEDSDSDDQSNPNQEDQAEEAESANSGDEETPEERAQREKDEAIERILGEQKADSQQEREEEMRRQEEMAGDWTFDYYGDIW